MKTTDSIRESYSWSTTHITRYLVFTYYSYQRFLAKRLRELEIGISYYPVLLYLYQMSSNSDAQEFSQAHLSRETAQDKGLLSRSLKKLLNHGYVSIRTNPENGSSSLVGITDSGMEVATKIAGFVDEWEHDYWDVAVDDEDKEACLKAIQAMSVRILED